MFAKILVPLDGSELAERALPYALDLARSFSASVDLVQVIPPFHTSAGEVCASQEPAPAESYLDRVARDLRHHGLEVSTLVQSSSSNAQAILERASSQKAELILLCSHGHSGLERWAFGSTAGQIVRHASCPTLVVPARGQSVPGFHKIVVPVDGSGAAEGALEFALKLARRYRSELTLLRTYAYPDQQMQTEVYLTSLAQNTPYDVTCSPRFGAAPETLLESVPEFDLVIMTSHGRRNLARWVLGSVAERMLEHATRPILIINRDALKARRLARHRDLHSVAETR